MWLFIKGDIFIGKWSIFGVEVFLRYSQFFVKGNFVWGGVECTWASQHFTILLTAPWTPLAHNNLPTATYLTCRGPSSRPPAPAGATLAAMGHLPRGWLLGQLLSCHLLLHLLIQARNTSINYRIQLTLGFHHLFVSVFELWNTIWHSYQVYKELKPQHLNSTKTRTVNNNNVLPILLCFFAYFHNKQKTNYTVTKPLKLSSTERKAIFFIFSSLFSIICTYPLGIFSSSCSTKCKQHN